MKKICTFLGAYLSTSCVQTFIQSINKLKNHDFLKLIHIKICGKKSFYKDICKIKYIMLGVIIILLLGRKLS